MEQNEPLIERNSCLKEFFIQLESNIRMDAFERKQHYNFPCAFSCQGTLILEFH